MDHHKKNLWVPSETTRGHWVEQPADPRCERSCCSHAPTFKGHQSRFQPDLIFLCHRRPLGTYPYHLHSDVDTHWRDNATSVDTFDEFDTFDIFDKVDMSNTFDISLHFSYCWRSSGYQKLFQTPWDFPTSLFISNVGLCSRLQTSLLLWKTLCR